MDQIASDIVHYHKAGDLPMAQRIARDHNRDPKTGAPLVAVPSASAPSAKAAEPNPSTKPDGAGHQQESADSTWPEDVSLFGTEPKTREEKIAWCREFKSLNPGKVEKYAQLWGLTHEEVNPRSPEQLAWEAALRGEVVEDGKRRPMTHKEKVTFLVNIWDRHVSQARSLAGQWRIDEDDLVEPPPPEAVDATEEEIAKLAFLRLEFLPRLRQPRHHGGVRLEDGRWFYPKVVERLPNDGELLAHIRGTRPVSCFWDTPGDDYTRGCTIDIDNKKGAPDTVLLPWLKKVEAALVAQSLHPLWSRSTGGKGIHGNLHWVRDQPKVFVLGMVKTVVRSVPAPAGIAVEFFPKRAYVDEKGKRVAGITLPLSCGRGLLQIKGGDFIDRPLCDPWQKSAPVKQVPDPDVEAKPFEHDAELEATFIDGDRIASALLVLDPDDHDRRVSVGMALKAHYGNGAADRWVTWAMTSARVAEKHGEEGLRKKWAELQPTHTGIGALFKYARDAGWQVPEDLEFRSNDRSTAQLLARRYGGDHRAVLDDKNCLWRYFNVAHHLWESDPRSTRIRAQVEPVADHIRAYGRRVVGAGDKKKGEALIGCAWRLENEDGRNSVVKYLETNKMLAARLDDFDALPGKLLFSCGTLLDTDTWEVRPVVAADLLTKKLPFPYVAPSNDPLPLFDSYISFLLDPDEREVLMHALAVALVGHGARLKYFPYLYGPQGDEGKTVLFLVLEQLLGNYYVNVAENALLAAKQGWISNTDLSPAIRAWCGARFLVMPEVTEGQLINEPRFRLTTGGESMEARGMRENLIRFKSTWVLFGYGNELPRFSKSHEATLRRVLVLKCPRQVPKEKQDARLPQKIVEEGARLIARLLWLYKTKGLELAVPERIRMGSDELMKDHDWVANFCTEYLEPVPGVNTSMRAVAGQVRAYWDANYPGHQFPFPQARTLYARIREPGYVVESNSHKDDSVLVGHSVRPAVNDERF